MVSESELKDIEKEIDEVIEDSVRFADESNRPVRLNFLVDFVIYE